MQGDGGQVVSVGRHGEIVVDTLLSSAVKLWRAVRSLLFCLLQIVLPYGAQEVGRSTDHPFLLFHVPEYPSFPISRYCSSHVPSILPYQ